MTPDIFAEWLRRQGHRVVRTRSSYWFDSGPRVFQAFPYHWVIRPTEDELRDFFFEENAIGLRYSTDLEADEGACSYHIVFERLAYGIQDVDASIRAKVRRGLEACQVGPIPLERYASEGWPLERDTRSRQQRHSRHRRPHWDRMVRAAADLDGFEAWGAEVGGRLAASLLFVRIDDCIDMLYQQSLTEFLPQRVNNALLFEVTRALAADAGVRLIHNGLHSLDAPPSVDQFKARLGYSVRPVRQRVVFHPRLAPWVGDGVSRCFGGLAALYPKSDYLQKAEGLVRFHANGKLPLARQPFPELLASEREDICRRLGSPLFRELETPAPQGLNIQISPGTPADLAEVVALHLACSSAEEGALLGFGRGFIRAAYRWFLTSPGTLVLVARSGDRLVGLTALSDRPYGRPLLRACRWQAMLGFLRRPWLAARPDWWSRLGPSVPSAARPCGGAAQIAFTCVAAEVRGCGIGRGLKQASIRACLEWGAESINTGVRRENARARALNEQAGFVEVPELSSERLVHLRLTLDPQEGRGRT
ncbi:MAG: GNAT family N-acetyltransferase [Geothrix sp.]|uniref:GNAT family N-acetyltransferase n=1 Tax=Geothrix sp. TaxID=1962974 RepID=UPI0017BFF990|nr:GNAT family N-acetyltransferase [Geothrix sp.]NWJ42563.1 GNAT family N-acetyltransferase [Geothrix sp.]WIL19477.1 MAG: GNAT family N-acetyltransferase [Geothrix sp.]